MIHIGGTYGCNCPEHSNLRAVITDIAEDLSLVRFSVFKDTKYAWEHVRPFTAFQRHMTNYFGESQ